MKVWVLMQESGCCGVFFVGVYGSLDAAQAVEDERQCSDDIIEEHELDERLDWRHGPVFRFELSPLEGESQAYRSRSRDEWRHPEEATVEINGPVLSGDRHHWIRVESPISMEHAEQIARARHEEWCYWRKGVANDQDHQAG